MAPSGTRAAATAVMSATDAMAAVGPLATREMAPTLRLHDGGRWYGDARGRSPTLRLHDGGPDMADASSAYLEYTSK